MVATSVSPWAFPGPIPVAEGNFLAYSCAAARDLHPLPCLRQAAKTRVPKEIAKSGNNRGNECSGWGAGPSNGSLLPGSLLPMADCVEYEGEDYAQQQRRGQRKIERGVFAAEENVSGEAAEGEVRAAEESQNDAGRDQHRAQEDQQLA